MSLLSIRTRLLRLQTSFAHFRIKVAHLRIKVAHFRMKITHFKANSIVRDKIEEARRILIQAQALAEQMHPTVFSEPYSDRWAKAFEAIDILVSAYHSTRPLSIKEKS